ncbi:hypothetical protein [Streptomyces sp. NPDC008317]|uniref:hypothetical protein n=1 Tax=Streptomyces sp. NPDC008317 TaxID=3364827 RepID=UPI0036E2E562
MFNTTSVAADAGPNKDTDPAGLNLVKTTAYDAQGRVIKATLPKSTGTDPGPPSRPTVPPPAPAWTAQDATGIPTRNVQSIGGDLAAATAASDPDSTILQLTRHVAWGTGVAGGASA